MELKLAEIQKRAGRRSETKMANFGIFDIGNFQFGT